jgi:hypothetical protein
MTNSLTNQYAAALIPIAVLCLLAFLSVDFSPALAAALLRLADVRSALATVRSMIGPLCANGDWLSPLGLCERSFGPTTLSGAPCQRNGA